MGGKDIVYIDLASKLVIYSLPSVFFDLQTEAYMNYSESRLTYRPIVICYSVVAVIHPMFCYYFISHLNLGVVGVAICSNLTNFIKMSIYITYFSFNNDYPETNTLCCQKEVFEWKSFREIFFLSLTCAVIFYTEMSGFNIQAILVNKLSELSYAKYIMWITLSEIPYSLSLAWMTTNSVMVGYYIGLNSPKNVAKFVSLSFYLMLIICIPLLIFLYIFRYPLLRFISEYEPVNEGKDMDFILMSFVLSQIFNMLHLFYVGVLRGCEKLFNVTLATIGVFTIILPFISYYFMFKLQMDILGGIIASAICYFIITCLSYIFYLFIDYKEVCDSFAKLEAERLNTQHNGDNQDHQKKLEDNPDKEKNKANLDVHVDTNTNTDKNKALPV